MDSVLNIKNFPLLESTLTDANDRKSVRLLCIFGCNASEVIFATNDDKVYAFGRNRFGGLGLGTDDENIDTPQWNTTLSDKQLSNIFCGFEHWIALTSEGQAYAWGHNDQGQLGIEGLKVTNKPLHIYELAEEVVVQMSCGAAYTMCLTAEGQVCSHYRINGFVDTSSLLLITGVCLG